MLFVFVFNVATRKFKCMYLFIFLLVSTFLQQRRCRLEFHVFFLPASKMGSETFSSSLIKNCPIVPTAQTPCEMRLTYVGMQSTRHPWHLAYSTYAIITVGSLYLSCYGESRKLQETLKCQREFFTFLGEPYSKYPFHSIRHWTTDAYLRPCSQQMPKALFSWRAIPY